MYKLMIIDDEPDIIDGLKLLIDWTKFKISNIETANGVFEAVDKALDFLPNIVICDIRLNDGWGYEIIQKFNQLNINSNFIMMSGYDDFNYVRNSMVQGAKEYLLKPIEKIKLEQALEKIIVENLCGNLDSTNISENIDSITNIEYSKYSNLTNKIINILKRDYYTNISLKVIAEKFMMNSKYLGRIFLQDTGYKFSEYLLCLRMEVAKELLLTTDYTVQQISIHVGYTQLNYFYTHFKNYFNISPTDLKNSYK